MDDLGLVAHSLICHFQLVLNRRRVEFKQNEAFDIDIDH